MLLKSFSRQKGNIMTVPELNYAQEAKHQREIRRLRKEYNRKNWFKNFLDRVVKLFKR